MAVQELLAVGFLLLVGLGLRVSGCLILGCFDGRLEFCLNWGIEWT